MCAWGRRSGGGPGCFGAAPARQVEEFLLTATQTLLGVAALLALRFPRWAAWTLLGLFAIQFAHKVLAAAIGRRQGLPMPLTYAAARPESLAEIPAAESRPPGRAGRHGAPVRRPCPHR
jgi:hypothetical protein